MKRDTKVHVLLDVRPSHHFSICSIPNSVNVPIQQIRRSSVKDLNKILDTSMSIYTICRRGNDSQLAARILLDQGYKKVCHIEGGLEQWAADIDHDFPIY